jgi:hypothetical protein
MAQITGGSGGVGSSLVSYATTASFPATGTSNVFYLASDSSKIYRWESTVYVEVGAIATGISAADLTTGTLPDARLSSTVTTALTNARTPTSHASSHATGGSDAISIAASQIASGTIATARLASGTADSTTYLRGDQTWATVAAGSSSASDLTSGTLSQARLDFIPIHPFLMMGG